MLTQGYHRARKIGLNERDPSNPIPARGAAVGREEIDPSVCPESAAAYQWRSQDSQIGYAEFFYGVTKFIQCKNVRHLNPH